MYVLWPIYQIGSFKFDNMKLNTTNYIKLSRSKARNEIGASKIKRTELALHIQPECRASPPCLVLRLMFRGGELWRDSWTSERETCAVCEKIEPAVLLAVFPVEGTLAK